MLSKKSVKIISTILLVVMMVMTMGSTVFADGNGTPTTAQIPTPASGVTINANLNSTIQNVLGIVKWGGLVTAVAVAMFIGIKYITASPDGKAEVKKVVIYYVLGIAILLSASTIVTIIADNIKL